MAQKSYKEATLQSTPSENSSTSSDYQKKLTEQRKSITIWLLSKGDNSMELVKFIAKGGFSMCWLLQNRTENNKIALKVIDKNDLSATKRLFIKNEFEVHKKLHHPNIVEFYRYASHDNLIFMFLEYCTMGSLAEFTKKISIPPKNMTKNIIKQLVTAIIYIHRKHIIHRDIKLGNILLSGTRSKFLVKLGDFGLSIFNPYDQPQNKRCGTLKYLAPEMLDKSELYSYPIDIWGVGIVTYILMTGYGPFDSASDVKTPDHDTFKSRVLTQSIKYPVSVSDTERKFISVCLEKNPEIRSKADQLVYHDYFS